MSNDEGVMTKEIRMPNDECRKRASQASRECKHPVIRASDFVIFSSFVIAYKAWRPKVALFN